MTTARSSGVGLLVEPLLVELGHGAVLLHAVERVLQLGTKLGIVLRHRRRPVGARVLELEVGHELRVLVRGIDDRGVAAERGVGAARQHRLGRVGLGVVDLHGEAVLLAHLLGERLVGRALVDRHRLALEVFPALDRRRALLDAELEGGPQIARGEQHVLRPLLGHRGRRGDEVVAAGLHARDQRREAHRIDGDVALHALGHLGEDVDLEAFGAAAQLGHGVRREGAVDAGAQRRLLVLSRCRPHAQEGRDRDRSQAPCDHFDSLP